MKQKILLFFSLLTVTLCSNAQVNLYQGATLLNSYATVTAANAAIPATLTSAYTIELTAAYTGAGETYPLTFTARTGASAINTITLRPAAGVASVSIASTFAGAIISLNDADYVIIDGRAGGTGNTSALTISNTSTASTSFTIQFINGATFNKVMYCNVTNATTTNTGRCIYWTTSATNPTGNSDNDISFCKFTGGRYMINTSGTAANPNTRNRLYGCEMINAVFAAVWYQANSGKITIDSCTIHNTLPIAETLYFGILFDSQIDSAIITKNKIYDLGVSGTGTVRAIHFRSSTAGTPKYSMVANNMIALSSANASATNIGGIEYSYSSNGVESHMYFNSIHVQGTQTSGGTSGNVGSAALIINGTSAASTFDTRNNLFVNSRSGGTAGLQHLAYSNTSTNASVVSNYNNYFSTSGNLVRIGTTVYTTMSAYAAAAAPNEANSFMANPPFISSTDLHVAASAGTDPQFAGTPITGITTDIDGQTRNATTPLRGADEIVTVACTLAATSTQTNVSCNGGNNGSATVTATGGSGYTYSWSPSGGSSATASGLSAGPYAVTVTSGSCSVVVNLTISEPSAITTVVSAQTNVSCNGGNNGSATVSASGGTGSYTYSWSPSGGSSASATNLTAGTYTVTVTDANGCPKTQTVTITQPSAITSGVSAQTNVTCNGGNNGSATVSASGGTGSYTYSWSPSGGSSASATNLAAGTYNVTITDANSCTKVQTVTITQPAAVTMNAVANQTACNGTSAAVSFSSAISGTTYAWTNNNTAIGLAASGTGNIAAFTAVNNGTAAVTATVTVTPSNGSCTGAPVTFTITVNPSPTVTLAPFAPICQSTGAITLTGGLPAGGTYTVDGVTQTVFNPANYGSGAHTIVYTYTNSFGCPGSATQTITLSSPFTVVLTTTPSQNITPANPVTLTATVSPVQSYIYQWIKNGNDTLAGNNSSQLTLQASMSGNWEVLVTSVATGCKIKSAVSNVMPAANAQLYVWPNPNNGEFTVSYYGTVSTERRTVSVYDSKGAKVYSREFVQSVPYTSVKISLNVTSGTYHARITDSNGKTLAGASVVVRR